MSAVFRSTLRTIGVVAALTWGVWLSAQPPAPVTNPQMALLQVAVTSPTTGTTYDAGTSDTLTTLSGTATGSHPILTCTWSNSLGGSGTTTGTTSWSITSVALTVGANVITVTCLTDQGLSRSDVVTVTRSSGAASNPISASRQPCASTAAPNTCWASAGVHIIGQAAGIPHRTTICYQDTGGLDTVGTINTQIAGCAAGQVVLLQAGTYTFASGITIGRSNVTLRGAGSGSSGTKLVISGTAFNCTEFLNKAISICRSNDFYGGDSGTIPHTALWTAGYSQGGTVITLSSVTGLAVGDPIFIDQLDDIVGDGTTSGWPGEGDFMWCQNDANACSSDGGGTYNRSGRTHVEVHQVTAINGSDVTIDPPILSPDFRATGGCQGASGTCTPGAWWGDSAGGSPTLIENVGVEDLTLDFTGSQAGIWSANTSNSWIRNVRLVRTGGPGSFVFHVTPVQAFRFETRDSYFYGPEVQGNTQYTYTPHLGGSLLFENNIVHNAVTPVTGNDPETGSVIGYNYTDASHYSTGFYQMHHSGDGYNLLEGNDGGNVYSDVNHGPHHAYTFFRNYFNGEVHNAMTAFGTGAAQGFLSHSRFYNSVGNVMSWTGWTTYSTSNLQGNNAIFSLGWGGNGGGGVVVFDTHVARTLFRWGNWDNVTSSADNTTGDQTGTRWCGNSSNSRWTQNPGCNSTTEVPSAITNFPNAIPSTETLPSSLYLSAKPSWFGSNTWPPIGPDVTNSGSPITNTGGHVYKIPARVCFESLAVDGAYSGTSPQVKDFDGDVCYP